MLPFLNDDWKHVEQPLCEIWDTSYVKKGWLQPNDPWSAWGSSQTSLWILHMICEESLFY